MAAAFPGLPFTVGCVNWPACASWEEGRRTGHASIQKKAAHPILLHCTPMAQEPFLMSMSLHTEGIDYTYGPAHNSFFKELPHLFAV